AATATYSWGRRTRWSRSARRSSRSLRRNPARARASPSAMATVGRALLIVAFAVALYGIGASLYGAFAGGRAWVDSGRRAVYALAGVLTLAFAILEAAFLRSDFSFNVVATHSSTT